MKSDYSLEDFSNFVNGPDLIRCNEWSQPLQRLYAEKFLPNFLHLGSQCPKRSVVAVDVIVTTDKGILCRNNLFWSEYEKRAKLILLYDIFSVFWGLILILKYKHA
jgi:hypothetical protein